MSEEQNSIFLFLMSTLAEKPSQTQAQLLKDLKQKLKDDGTEVKNLKKQMDATISVAEKLGLLAIENDAVKSLFQLKATPEANDDNIEEPEDRARRRRSSRRRSRSRRSRSRRRRR